MALLTTFMARPPPSPTPLMPHLSAAGTFSSREKYASMWRPNDSLVVRYGSTSMNRNSCTLNDSFCMQASITLPVHQFLLKTEGASSPMSAKKRLPQPWMLASS